MSKLLQPLKFNCGLEMKNRFMLAPLTNTQSHSDGVLSEEEFNWLEMRAAGGFGLTMTCAAIVSRAATGQAEALRGSPKAARHPAHPRFWSWSARGASPQSVWC